MYISLKVYRDNTLFAQNTPGTPVAIGSTTDYGGRPIEYRAEARNNSTGQVVQSYYSVRLTGANTPPMPEVMVDGYPVYGGIITKRSANVWPAVTMRFRAKDIDGNLSGIRPNWWNPDSGFFYNNVGNMIPQSGDFGEYAATISLGMNGDWYFWTDATDLAGAYSSTGHWGDGFKLTVIQARDPDNDSEWLDVNQDGILDEVFKPGSTGCMVNLINWDTYCYEYWWYPVYDSFYYWDTFWPASDFSYYFWINGFQYVWMPDYFWASCETNVEAAITFNSETGHDYQIYNDQSGSQTANLANWTLFTEGNFGGGSNELSLGWAPADELYFGQYWLVRLGKKPFRTIASDSAGNTLGLISEGSTSVFSLPDDLSFILDALDVTGKTIEELLNAVWDITTSSGSFSVSGSTLNLGLYGPGTYNICLRAGTGENAVQLCFVIILEPPLNLSSVTWTALDGSTLPTNGNPGGGLKVYPDASTPTGPANNRVQIRAQLNQAKSGVPVTFAVFDVDDPSSRDVNLDRESAGADNLGPLKPPPTNAVTNASGTAIVEFEVSLRPGDNYRAVASLQGSSGLTGITAKQDDGTNARLFKDGNAMQQTNRTKFSEMLTVWRRIRLETDSMGVPSGNSVTGMVTAVAGSGRDKKVTTSATLVDSANRFVGGTITQSGNTWIIGSSGADSGGANVWVVAVRPNSTDPIPIVGQPATIVDDDLTSDVWAPAIDYASYLFSLTYIDIVTGEGIEESNRPFVANAGTAAEVGAIVGSGKNGHAPMTNAFWYTYLIGGFQGAKDRDKDPNTEVTGTLGAAGRNQKGNPTGTIIFIETIRDVGTWEAGIVAHEFGHYFGGGTHDTGGSIMEENYLNTTNWTFTPKRIKWIRSFEVVP